MKLGMNAMLLQVTVFLYFRISHLQEYQCGGPENCESGYSREEHLTDLVRMTVENGYLIHRI
jgi:hypothetical protein